MNKLLEFFDSFTEKIPLNILLYIRMSAIFIWVLAAVVAVYYSWNEGVSSAPPVGQDAYLSEIKEKETVEENLKNPPPLSIPSIEELHAGGKSELPDLQDVIPERKDEKTLPPYISEKQTPDDTGAFLPKTGGDPELRRQEKPSDVMPKNSESGTVKGGLLPP